MSHVNSRTAVYPGTFDPMTLGHEDLMRRAARLFDRLILAVAAGHHKRTMFTIDERLDIASEIAKPYGNIEVVAFRGLLRDFVVGNGGHVVVRGLRAVSDFEYELQMAGMNRQLMPDVETLFNWLGQDLSGWRCLDAFAGSGALGFEAASRGAAQVLLLERDATLVRNLRQSQKRLSASNLRVESADALAWMAACAPASFELVLLDPPFDAGLLPQALSAAAALVVDGGFVYAESAEGLSIWPPRLQSWRQGRAGAVHFQLFRCGG